MATETCTQPDAMEEGDLLAYAHGTAGQDVRNHVAGCPACQRQAQELAALAASLGAALYRLSCPPAQQIADYQAGELAAGPRLVVAQHLRECPHCAREMAGIARDSRGGLAGWLGAPIHTVEASPRALPVLAGALRGPAGPALEAASLRIYQAGRLEVIIHQLPSNSHPSRADLSGLIHAGGRVPDGLGTAAAELYRGEGLLDVTPVSPRGQFAFAAVEPGSYDLCLVWGRRAIWLRTVLVA